MKVRAVLAGGLLLAGSVACGSTDVVPEVRATGPAEVDAALVERHAEQFDEDVAVREAGSQQEQAASVYITGHLQLAGYVVFLDGVPVADLIRSTNVIARPPDGGAPELVVVAPYDTPEGGPSNGTALGLFLELARAANVAAPGHAAGFSALGAEHAQVAGGSLGSRREAQRLLDEDAGPLIVTLGEVGEGVPLRLAGDVSDALLRAFVDCPGEDCVLDDGGDAGAAGIFSRAGFDHVIVDGDPETLGPALLDLIASGGR